MRRALAGACAALAVAGCSATARPASGGGRPAPRGSPSSSRAVSPPSPHAPHAPATARAPVAQYRPVAATRVGRALVFQIATTTCEDGTSRTCTRIYRSGDGGHSWSQVAAPPQSLEDAAIAFADTRVGWLVARHFNATVSTTWVTHDAGGHWQQLPLRAVAALAATSARVYFATDRDIYVGTSTSDTVRRVGQSVGSQLLVQGGAIYNYDSEPKLASGPRLAEIVGDRIRTVSSPCAPRSTWSVGLSGTPNGGLLIVCGSEPGAGLQDKRAYFSRDQGRTWRRVAAPGESGYVDDGAVGSAGAFIDGGRMQLEATFDNGRAWHVAVSGSGTAGGVGPVGFSQLRYGWAVDRGPPAALYLTDDGGRTWHGADHP